MRNLVIGLFVFLSFVFQTTILQYISIFGVVPNICLVIIICLSLLKGSNKGAAVGIAIGFLYDIMFSSVLGVTALIYFFIGYFSGMFNKKVFTSTTLTPFVFTAIATVVFNLYQIMCFYLSNSKFDYFELFGEIVLVEIIYNSIVSIFIFKLISKIIITPNLRFIGRRKG